jgi:hypothetical protein
VDTEESDDFRTEMTDRLSKDSHIDRKIIWELTGRKIKSYSHFQEGDFYGDDKK